MTIVKRKLEFHNLFGSMGKMTLEDSLFNNDKFINRFKEDFGIYVAYIYSDSKLDILKSNYEVYIRVYNANHTRVVYARDSFLQAVRLTGAAVICLSYYERKLAHDYLIRNLTPLYNRLSKVDGIIEKEEVGDIDSFIFVNVAKHMMGRPTDVSETIYAYFLEAEEL